MTKHERLNVVFISPTNVLSGASLEQFILNILRDAPKELYNITLIQSDSQSDTMTSESYAEKALEGIKVITEKTIMSHTGFLNKNKITIILQANVVKPIVYSIEGLFWSKASKKAINSADVIYLLDNQLASAIHPNKRTLVIGSTHVIKLKKGAMRLRDKVLKIYRSFIYRKIDGIHFLSSQLKANSIINKRYDFVVPYGVNTDIFFPNLKQKTKIAKFLIVCRLEESKGILVLLNAWKILNQKKSELHIAGKGSLENVIKEASKSYGNIIYHGAVKGENLAKLYRQSDIFVFPSKWETFGLVMLEAFSSGLFVVADNHLRGGFSDDFLKLKTLVYVERTPEAFAYNMLKAEMNLKKTRRSSQKIKVYNYVKKNYDAKIISRRLFELFKEKYEQKNE